MEEKKDERAIYLDGKIYTRLKDKKTVEKFNQEVWYRPLNQLLLKFIFENKGVSIREITKHIMLSYGSIYTRLKKLEELGVVKIERSPDKIDNKNKVSIEDSWVDYISSNKKHLNYLGKQKELLKFISKEKCNLLELYTESFNPDKPKFLPVNFMDLLFDLNNNGYLDISMKLTKFGKALIKEK